MYFHPLVSYVLYRERLLAAGRDAARVRVDGVHRRSSLQGDAVATFAAPRNPKPPCKAASQSSSYSVRG